MSDKLEDVKRLAIEWLSHSSTELYGKQLMFVLEEPTTLWELFEKEEDQ